MGGGVLGSIPEPRGRSKRESCLRAPHQTDWTDPMECECRPEDSVGRWDHKAVPALRGLVAPAGTREEIR